MREHLERKRREKRKEEEEKLKLLDTPADVWKYINKKRGKRRWRTDDIKLREWKIYFADLLEGEHTAEDKGRKNEGSNDRTMEGEEIGSDEEDCGITVDEVSEALKKMKRRKAPGIDSIPMEAWIYGGAAVKKGLVDLLQRIWKKGDVPEDWRIGIITPIFKKGDVSKVENYRGISLLCMAYKIYAEIVRRRLETETERKELLMESQCGFRRGRGTIDNVFVLNHLIQREKIEKKDKIYVVFVDLKAAFDNVDRELLWDILDKNQ